MIYFTSDQHFFYRKGRPHIGDMEFPDAERKNQYLIKRWNETIKPEDQVYILGDFSDGNGPDTAAVLKQLKGEKYLIIGNNDHYLEDPSFEPSLFVWCRQYHELWYREEKYVLFHFPIEVWSGCRKNRIHVHGHTHGRQAVPAPIRRYEVGVDAHDGRPVSIEQVWEAVKEFNNKAASERIYRN
ncbi:MAG: metallophosphoesterase [Lachnospiraceae bacterium]|nr:metallophosphoesterase [Lachnospiraceae bacterium]